MPSRSNGSTEVSTTRRSPVTDGRGASFGSISGPESLFHHHVSRLRGNKGNPWSSFRLQRQNTMGGSQPLRRLWRVAIQAVRFSVRLEKAGREGVKLSREELELLSRAYWEECQSTPGGCLNTTESITRLLLRFNQPQPPTTVEQLMVHVSFDPQSNDGSSISFSKVCQMMLQLKREFVASMAGKSGEAVIEDELFRQLCSMSAAARRSDGLSPPRHRSSTVGLESSVDDAPRHDPEKLDAEMVEGILRQYDLRVRPPNEFTAPPQLTSPSHAAAGASNRSSSVVHDHAHHHTAVVELSREEFANFLHQTGVNDAPLVSPTSSQASVSRHPSSMSLMHSDDSFEARSATSATLPHHHHLNAVTSSSSKFGGMASTTAVAATVPPSALMPHKKKQQHDAAGTKGGRPNTAAHSHSTGGGRVAVTATVGNQQHHRHPHQDERERGGAGGNHHRGVCAHAHGDMSMDDDHAAYSDATIDMQQRLATIDARAVPPELASLEKAVEAATAGTQWVLGGAASNTSGRSGTRNVRSHSQRPATASAANGSLMIQKIRVSTPADFSRPVRSTSPQSYQTAPHDGAVPIHHMNNQPAEQRHSTAAAIGAGRKPPKPAASVEVRRPQVGAATGSLSGTRTADSGQKQKKKKQPEMLTAIHSKQIFSSSAAASMPPYETRVPRQQFESQNPLSSASLQGNDDRVETTAELPLRPQTAPLHRSHTSSSHIVTSYAQLGSPSRRNVTRLPSTCEQWPDPSRPASASAIRKRLDLIVKPTPADVLREAAPFRLTEAQQERLSSWYVASYQNMQPEMRPLEGDPSHPYRFDQATRKLAHSVGTTLAASQARNVNRSRALSPWSAGNPAEEVVQAWWGAHGGYVSILRDVMDPRTIGTVCLPTRAAALPSEEQVACASVGGPESMCGGPKWVAGSSFAVARRQRQMPPAHAPPSSFVGVN